MIGVYIKGMEMPKKCIECKLIRRCGKNDMDYVCMPARVYVEDLANAYKPRPDYCPLVPVPPHGRLIDADALMKSDRMVGKLMMYGGEYVYTQAEINRAPTVIPAEPGEEEAP